MWWYSECMVRILEEATNFGKKGGPKSKISVALLKLVKYANLIVSKFDYSLSYLSCASVKIDPTTKYLKHFV